MQNPAPTQRAAQGQNVRNFTESDIENNHIYTDASQLIESELPWQKLGLQQTATGYGAKLTTGMKIRFNGKTFRLYCTQYSNAASIWFKTQGRTIYVS